MSITKPQNGCGISLYVRKSLSQCEFLYLSLFQGLGECALHDLPVGWQFGRDVGRQPVQMSGGHERKGGRVIEP